MKTANLKAQRINLFLVLKRHVKKILILGSLTFVVIAPVLYFTQSKTYSASLELRIDPVGTSMTPGVSSSDSMGNFYSEYVSTQKFKILKHVNIEKALKTLDPVSLSALISGNTITDIVIDSLEKSILISPAADSLILTLTITGAHPQGLAEFLNNLVLIYLDDLKNERTQQESNRIQYTDKQRTDLQAQINNDETQLKQIAVETDTGNFTTDDIPYRNEMKVQAETALRAENDRLMKEKMYNEFMEQQDKLKKLDVSTKIEEKLRADTLYSDQRRTIQSKIDYLNNQIAEGVATASSTSDNLSLLKKQLQDLDFSSHEKYRKQVETEVESAQEKQRMNLYSEYLVAKQYEEAIKTSFATIKDKYSFVSRKILVAQQLQQDLVDLKAQMGKMNSNISYFQGELQNDGLVTVENYAKQPVYPDKSKFMVNLILGFIASYSWVVMLAFVFEFLDMRIKSSEELKSFTGIKPSWPISHYPGSFLDVSLNASESVVNKAISSLATRINQERQDFQAKVVAFNGVGKLTGVTEIILNCAHNMKDNCEKILILDLNRDRPGLASKLSIPKELQFSAKKAMENETELCVFKDFDRGVDILSLRDLGQLENKIFDRILNLARNRYDIIFVDASPILKSSNTEHIFMKSDTVIIVVRGNVSKYNDLQHTLELADNFGVKSIGLVLNWWKSDRKYQNALELPSVEQV